MTTTANAMLENCCNPCCGWGDWCKNKWTINIESTNPHCLRVDTSECWVVKLEPVCPPVVEAWDDTIIVESVDCEEGADCSKKYKVKARCKDEKVKACDGDSTPGTLIDKLEEWSWITITPNWCSGGTNSTLVISVNEDELNVKHPELKIDWSSNLINFGVGWGDWHTILISDKSEETYDNMCCIGFESNQDFPITLNSGWNATVVNFMWENWHDWSIFTWNPDMATRQWLKILADGYYRLFWQLTVQNNSDDNFNLNLWRAYLRIRWNRFAKDTYLSTAKHWWYARQVLLKAWSWIDVTNEWEIKNWSWNWQGINWFNWPWMTYNIDTLVDLKEGDIVTLWYRPQSNNASNTTWEFRFVWQDDDSKWPNIDVLFWWTLLWVYQLAPKRFQKNSSNQVYDLIQ